MFQLTEGQKFLIIAICVALLAVTVLITVCVVTPVCWLHSCLVSLGKKMGKMKMNKANEYDGIEETATFKLTGTPQYTVETESSIPLAKIATDSHFKQSRKHREDSTYSSMSTSSRGDASISTYSEASVDMPTVDGEEINYGQVSFSLHYNTVDKEGVGQLIIVLKEAQDLPPRLYGGTCDPYLTVQIYRSKGRRRWSKNSLVSLYEFKTTTKKKTQHPLFKERFAMDIMKNDIKDCWIKISVFDEEKLANDTELGQVIVNLADLENSKEQTHTIDLAEPKQDNGEILFGLSYLPTAERLTFNVIKANNLHLVTEDQESFTPYVRIILLHNGKLLKKRKTLVKPGTLFPIYNESLTFDIPPSQLDHVAFIIVVTHRDPQDGSISSPESPTSPNSTKKNRYIGKVVIGSCVRGSALHHWNAMKQSPRKQVTQWHTLQ